MKILTALGLLGFSASVFANELAINWNPPEFGVSDIVHHARTKITGKATKNSKIYITRQRLVIIQNGKVLDLSDHKRILDQDLWFNLRSDCNIRDKNSSLLLGLLKKSDPFVVTKFNDTVWGHRIYAIVNHKGQELEVEMDKRCFSPELKFVPDLYDQVAGYPDFPPEIVQVDENGDFSYVTDVPSGIIQQSVTVEGPDKKTQDFIISFSVPKEKVIDWDNIYVYLDQWLPKFWIGAGINFLSYDQNGISSDDELRFQSFAGPDFRISGSYPIAKRWSLISSYKKTPGSAEQSSSAAFTILQSDYSWDTLGAEVVHHPRSWETRFLSGIHNFGGRLGVQHHWFPLYTATLIDEYDFVQGQATMLSAGFEGNYFRNHQIYYETLFRYQFPLASASDFELTPAFSADASVGAIYRLNPSFNLGIYWYGQYHSFEYSIDNPARGSVDTGTQDILYSSVEIRLGYTFGMSKYKNFIEQTKSRKLK